jgi:Uma2 family endonuclease
MVRAVWTPDPTRRRLTVEEFRRMTEAGILHEDDRVELLDGELYQMAAMNEPHVSCIIRLNRVFVREVDDKALVSPQNAIRLSNYSEPQPDIVLVRYRDDFYLSALPGPDDILLIVEVADTSLAYDRDRKIPRYAAAGIPEAWLVDLRRKRVTVYRDPAPGGYRQVIPHTRRAVLTPLAFPDMALRHEDIFGRG